LVSGFSSLPTMLSHYAISGYVPIMLPFRVWPWLLHQVMRVIVDKWESANRLREITQIVKARNGRLRLHLVHAKNDWDIPCHEDDKLFAGAVGGLVGEGQRLSDERLASEKLAKTANRGKHSFVTTWADGDIVIRQELFPHGGEHSRADTMRRETDILGHNDVMFYAPVLAAVMKSFGLTDESDE
jgi:abhydrolase domain-containing protein 12